MNVSFISSTSLFNKVRIFLCPRKVRILKPSPALFLCLLRIELSRMCELLALSTHSLVEGLPSSLLWSFFSCPASWLNLVHWNVLFYQPGCNSRKRMSFPTFLYCELWLYHQYSVVRALSVATVCTGCKDIKTLLGKVRLTGMGETIETHPMPYTPS